MKNHRPNVVDSGKLLRMLDSDGAAIGAWTEDELGTILQSELDAVMVEEVARAGIVALGNLEYLLASSKPAITSFGDLFQHATPPVELLVITKNFAKVCRGNPDRGLPAEVATVLYFTSIAVAQDRCGRRITEMDDASREAGVGWVLARPWVGESIRRLLQMARPT